MQPRRAASWKASEPPAPTWLIGTGTAARFPTWSLSRVPPLGGDYAKYVNESNVESVMEREGKRDMLQRKRADAAAAAAGPCPHVKAADVGKSSQNYKVTRLPPCLRIALSLQPKDNE